jgi:hypothetical protein
MVFKSLFLEIILIEKTTDPFLKEIDMIIEFN